MRIEDLKVGKEVSFNKTTSTITSIDESNKVSILTSKGKSFVVDADMLTPIISRDRLSDIATSVIHALIESDEDSVAEFLFNGDIDLSNEEAEYFGVLHLKKMEMF